MRTSKDLANALLKAASDAASGNANAEQCGVLCQVTDSLVKLARLEIEARRYESIPVHWLNGETAGSDRLDLTPLADEKTKSAVIDALERDLARAQVERGAHKTPASRKAVLDEDIQKISDRLKFLRYTKNKTLPAE